jgi:hypothetical protein
MDNDGRKKGRPTQIVVDLKGLRDPWMDWCRARGLRSSEALRQILTAVLKGNPTSAVAPHPADFEDEAGDQARRVDFRIPAPEYLALAAAAEREGKSVPRWLIALIRLHLDGDEPLGQAEVSALARSNQLLLALGRNINQIAYNMNQRVDKDELTLRQIEFALNFLREHTEATAKVIQASRDRWRR